MFRMWNIKRRNHYHTIWPGTAETVVLNSCITSSKVDTSIQTTVLEDIRLPFQTPRRLYSREVKERFPQIQTWGNLCSLVSITQSPCTGHGPYSLHCDACIAPPSYSLAYNASATLQALLATSATVTKQLLSSKYSTQSSRSLSH